MDTDDLEPPRKPDAGKPRDLEVMGVEQLRDYIEELRAEIARAEAVIARKGDARAAAESVFRKR